MVAGDFNGAAWRRRSGNDQRRDSTVEEAFANTNGPAQFRTDQVAVPGEWADVCGFIKPPSSETEWHIRMHGAFEINHEMLGINLPTRVATMRYGFISRMSTHGWLIVHLETGNIGGQSSGKETIRTTTGRITWPSTPANSRGHPRKKT